MQTHEELSCAYCATTRLKSGGNIDMESNKDTMDVMGKRFLKCQKEDCEWNIGWLGGNSWAEESGRGTRICNLGVKAMIEAETAPPDACPQASAVLELARAEFQV